MIWLIGGCSALNGIEPLQDFFSVFPTDQFFYFRIIDKKRLSIIDELFLHLFSMSQIQLQVNCCGLDVVMAEAVFDVRDRLPAAEHPYGTCVSEAMSRVDMLQSFIS